MWSLPTMIADHGFPTGFPHLSRRSPSKSAQVGLCREGGGLLPRHFSLLPPLPEARDWQIRGTKKVTHGIFHLGFPLEITNSWLVSWKIPSENAENAWFRGTPISRNLRDLSTNGFVTQVIFTTGMILQVFWLWQKLCAGLWKWDNTWWLMMVNDG